MVEVQKTVKSFNGTVVGNPTLDLDTGIVNGFGSNAYLTIPNSLGAIGNIFYYHFKTGSTPSSIVRLYTLEGFDAVLLDTSNKFLMYSWSAQTFYNFPVTATENTEYFVRIKTESGQRVYGASLDGGETYTDLLTVADTTYGPQPSGTFYLGCYSGGEYWNGSLYLNDCYVTDSNGIEIWRGVKTDTYYGSTFKVHQTLPYMFGARGVGYYDSVVSKVPTANEDILLTMKAYDGLTETYTEGIGTAGKVDFTGTILPWKWDYNSGLDVSKYCLMPSGLTYENIKTPDVLGRNFTVVGNPTINDSTGVVSNFGTGSFLKLYDYIELTTANKWTIIIKAQTNSNSSFQKLIGGGGINWGLTNNNYWHIWLFNGSSWFIDENMIDANSTPSDAYYKFEYDSTSGYKCSYSTDKENWTQFWSNSNTTKIGRNTSSGLGITFGAFHNGNEYWRSSINIKETSIYKDDQIYWSPYVHAPYSLPGCTYNFTDDGSATTLNAFAVQGDKNIVLTPDVEYYGNRYLGTVEIPQHDVYQYNNGTWQNAPHLIGGHTYYFKMIGGGGGSSTWDGGAGAYWEGYYTPAQTVAVTISQGGGGSGAGAYSRRHNGVKGGTTSIVGEGVSIVCEGGQGAIGLRNGDETGNSSTYTYAPTITITNGTYTTIKSSTTSRPRRTSWNDDTVTGYGAGGQAASGTKAPGNNGLAGYLEYYQVGTITINPTPADALVEMSLDGVEYTTTNSLKAKVDETVYYKVSKEGYITNDASVLVTGDATINVELTPSPTPVTRKRLVSVADNHDTNKLVLYTDDGINWNTSMMPNSRNWGHPFYGDGKFIVADYSSGIFAYSSDGINWTEGKISLKTPENSWRFCKGCYGNGKYIMIFNDSRAGYTGWGGFSIKVTSTDGINWNTGALPNQPFTVIDIIFDGTQFVLLGTGGEVKTSTDGETWINRTKFDTNITAYSHPMGNNAFVYNPETSTYCYAMPYFGSSDISQMKGQYIYVTNNLDSSWTRTEMNYGNVFPAASCIINNEIKFFSGWSSLSQQAAGYINVDSSGTATLVGSSVPRLNYQGGANIINDRAVVIGWASDQYIYSTDGTTWNTGTLPASSGWWGSCVGEVDA